MEGMISKEEYIGKKEVVSERETGYRDELEQLDKVLEEFAYSAVEEYGALAPDGVQVPVKDDSLENSLTESQEVEQQLE